MNKINKVIIIIIFTLVLVGCNFKVSTNELGIKEKQTNEYVNLSLDTYTAEYNSVLRFPIVLNFLKESLTFEVKKFYGGLGLHDGLSLSGEAYLKYSYNGSNKETIYFYPDFGYKPSEQANQYFVDIILRDNEKIIGYSIIQFIKVNKNTLQGNFVKNVVFPDAIKGKIVVLEDSINYLLSLTKPIQSIDEIYQEETNIYLKINFVYKDYTTLTFYRSTYNMSRICYSFQQSFSEKHKVCEYEFFYNGSTEPVAFEYGFDNLKNEDQYCVFIFKQGNEICGYAIIKVSYDSVNDKPNSEIITQINFPDKPFQGWYVRQKITKEEVMLLVDNKINETNNN
jgi:hypothetical protein